MKKIIFNIFLFFSINHIIVSDTCEELGYAKCFDEMNQNKKYPDYCCRYKAINPEDPEDPDNKFCKTVPYSSYFSGYKNEYIKGILFEVDCNNQGHNTFPLERCGNIHNEEFSFKSCKKYSTLVDSCCYFPGNPNSNDDNEQKGQKLEKGCYWLGSKYNGKINWADADLECHHKYLYCSLFYSIFCILSMIIFF